MNDTLNLSPGLVIYLIQSVAHLRASFMMHLMEFDLKEIPFSNTTLCVLLIPQSLPLSIPLLSFTTQVPMTNVRCSSVSVTRRQPCVSPRQNTSQLTTTTTRSSAVNKMNTTRSSVVNKMIRTRSSVVNKMTMTRSSAVNNIIRTGSSEGNNHNL